MTSVRLLKSGAETEVTIANKATIAVEGVGSVVVDLDVFGKKSSRKINNVIFVPDLCANLLSVKVMTMNGLTVKFEKEFCKISYGDEVIAVASLIGQLYRLNLWKDRTFLSYNLWHRRLAHPCFQVIMKMKAGGVRGINFKGSGVSNCQKCCEGKHAKLPFARSESRAEELLELIHSDVCGPIDIESFSGFRYFVTFQDDYSSSRVLHEK